MDKTGLSIFVFPDDKREFKRIVQLEKVDDGKRTVGDVFRDMLNTYRQTKSAKAV